MKKGTTKVSVFYPAGQGNTFDMDYYCNKHIPMVAGLLGDAVKGATVESGLASAAPGSSAPYAAMGNIYFESMDSFKKSFVPNAPTIMADTPNYTNAEPIVQISEVLI